MCGSAAVGGGEPSVAAALGVSGESVGCGRVVLSGAENRLFFWVRGISIRGISIFDISICKISNS